MVQICPFCKRIIKEEDTVCPYCNNVLPTETDWIKYGEQIRDAEWVKGKRSYYDRLNRVYVLGFSLLITAVCYWILLSRGIIYPNKITGITFALVWLVGFTLYFIYWRKGDRGFIWIH